MSDSDSDEADMTGPADERLPVGALHGSRPEGGTLVVCPTAVLSQWASEIEDKVLFKPMKCRTPPDTIRSALEPLGGSTMICNELLHCFWKDAAFQKQQFR